MKFNLKLSVSLLVAIFISFSIPLFVGYKETFGSDDPRVSLLFSSIFIIMATCISLGISVCRVLDILLNDSKEEDEK